MLLNLCMIGAMLAGIWQGHADDPERIAYLLAWSVTLAGVFQLLWLWFHARRAGFRFTLHRPRLTGDVRELGRLIRSCPIPWVSCPLCWRVVWPGQSSPPHRSGL